MSIRSLIKSLLLHLATNERKAALWLKQQNTIDVDFSDNPGNFVNINTADMLASIQKSI